MKRKLVLSAITASLALFMALPLLFDVQEEEPLPLNIEEVDKKGAALPFDHEGVAGSVLPTLNGQKNGVLPGKSSNFIGKYMERAGNFYRRGFSALTGGSARTANSAAGDLYASSTRASAERAGAADVFGDIIAGQPDGGGYVYYGTADNSYSPSAGVGTKQHLHNVAVKGVFAVSAVENDRFEAKLVYDRVIFNLDKAVPGMPQQKAERDYAPSKGLSQPEQAQTAAVGSSSGVNYESEYIGISSRPGGQSGLGGRGGGPGAFNNASVRGGEEKNFEFGAFEPAAAALIANMEKISGGGNGGSGQGVGNSGGQNNAAGGKPGQSGQNNNQANNTGGPGQGGGHNHNHNHSGNGGGQGTDPGGAQKPQAVPYDSNVWPDPNAPQVCVIPAEYQTEPPTTGLFTFHPAPLPGVSDQRAAGDTPITKPAEPDLNPDCPTDEDFLGKQKGALDIPKQYDKAVLNMGAADKEGEIYVPASGSTLDKIFTLLGFSVLTGNGKSEKNEALSSMPSEDFYGAASKPKTLNFTTNPDEKCENCINISGLRNRTDAESFVKALNDWAALNKNATQEDLLNKTQELLNKVSEGSEKLKK